MTAAMILAAFAIAWALTHPHEPRSREEGTHDPPRKDPVPHRTDPHG